MSDDAEKPAKKKKAPAKKKATPADKATKPAKADKAEKAAKAAPADDESAEAAPAEKVEKKKAAPKKKAAAKKKAAPAAEKKPAKKGKKKPKEEEEDEDTGPDAGEGDPDGKSLVIVESPAKAKTINKYLGKDYLVKASFGHVRDLPEKGGGLGVDIEKRFEPVYKLLSEKKKVVAELKKAARESSKIFLACDNDREGEAIAWHISEILKAKPERVSRITFNEITKTAIQRAIESPRQLDMAKVNAQQARRILDRIVGYKLSPILWKKVKRGLSAGRVQSVAVKLVVEREREIKAFLPIEYWDLEATLAKLDAPPAPAAPAAAPEAEAEPKEGPDGEKKVEPRQLGPGRFFAKLVQVDDEKLDPEKFRLKSADEAAALKKHLEESPFIVSSVKKAERRDNPSAPFITSTLQQQASTRLRFATNKTMRVAQSLYEGVDLGEEGAVGLITYMRTDSTNLAKEAIEEARDFIQKKYGKSYLPDSPPVYKSKAGAQEAHEAIRPTSADRSPESIEKFLTADQFKLYKLIWERYIACQMPAAVFSQTTVEVTAGRGLFRANGRTLIFDGHLKVTGASKKDEPILPDVSEQEKLNAEKLQESQHFTQPPPRYTEASLVKVLEEKGIGRPSTYASIISTIQDRGYVKQENRRLFASELGMIVTDRLAKHFHEIMDEGFTAEMESRLDRIESEKVEWKTVLENFYGPFEKDVTAADKAMKGLNEEPEESTVPCPKCGRLMVKMWNKNEFTRFLGCPGYKTDECKETMPLDEQGAPAPPEETDETCPECGTSMVIRTGRRGRFLSCAAYPNCKVTRELADDGQQQLMPNLEVPCPLCTKKMVVRRGRRGPFLGCTGYPECKSTLPIVTDPETGQPKAGEKSAGAAAMPQVDIKCEKCGAQMLVRRSRRGPFLGCSKYPKCRGTAQLPDDVKDKLPKPAPPKELGEECDKCGKPLVIKFGRRGPFAACSGYPECKNTKPLPAGTS